MAKMKRTTTTTKGHPFYARLKALGCTLCRECNAYMPAVHAHYTFEGPGPVYIAPAVIVNLTGELEAVAA